jgi:hypothetical protein
VARHLAPRDTGPDAARAAATPPTTLTVRLQLFGDASRATTSGLVGFLILFTTAVVMILRDPTSLDPVLIFGLLGSTVAYLVGLVHARADRAAGPAAPAPPPAPES